jgi:flagellar protein FliT
MPDDGRQAAQQKRSLIGHYEAIAQASHAMLAAARTDDWERVSALESDCRALIARLQADAAHTRLGADEQHRRVQLLREILADDAEIRARSEPWLRELEALFAGGRPRRSG